MPTLVDTLTIVLDGDVPLGEFARTIESFYELVKALSAEVGAPDLDWVLDDLQFSSAVATARALGDPRSAEKVVNAYGEVGHSLETGTDIVASPRVREAARKVVSIEDGRVKRVRFEMQLRESIIKVVPIRAAELIEEPVRQDPVVIEIQATPAPVKQPTSSRPKLAIARPAALGGVQGRVQALSSRGGLRFTVYDLLNDKAIGCYITEGKEELLRNIWGRLAVVEGLITRDPVTGRPLSIRQVHNITPLPDPYIQRDYEQARGALRSLAGGTPEEAIRRMRDA